jgi:hypothetical protein
VTGEFNKVVYIPGESREYILNRRVFLEQGGATLLILLEQQGEEGVRQEARAMLARLDMGEWEQHERAVLPPCLARLAT